MIENTSVVKVGIADMNIVRSPSIIRTAGLGSCVGVVLYDPVKEIAGMVHIMLPYSSIAKEKEINPAKFADTGIKLLQQALAREGVRKAMLRAKIAGGAQMFQFNSSSDLMRIGPRNVEAVKKTLEQMKIALVAEDCGGNNGRTIEFNPQTKLLSIKTINKKTREI